MYFELILYEFILSTKHFKSDIIKLKDIWTINRISTNESSLHEIDKWQLHSHILNIIVLYKQGCSVSWKHPIIYFDRHVEYFNLNRIKRSQQAMFVHSLQTTYIQEKLSSLWSCLGHYPTGKVRSIFSDIFKHTVI